MPTPSMVRRRFFSMVLFVCALCMALLLAGCAGTTSASGSDAALNAILDGTTPEVAGFTLAGQVTPVAATPGPGTGNSNAPALFGGDITQITKDATGTVWTVAGRAVHITRATTINTSMGQPQVGAHVTVGGTPRADGGADAVWVRVDQAAPGANATGAGAANDAVTGTGILTGTGSASPATSTTGRANNGEDDGDNGDQPGNNARSIVYCGYIEQLPQAGIIGDWRVSNRKVHVGQATQVQAQDNRFDLGRFAFVRGALQADGSVSAQRVVVRPSPNSRCLPGLRVGQNDGAPGPGNGNDGPGNGNGNGNGRARGKGNGQGNGD